VTRRSITDSAKSKHVDGDRRRQSHRAKTVGCMGVFVPRAVTERRAIVYANRKCCKIPYILYSIMLYSKSRVIDKSVRLHAM